MGAPRNLHVAAASLWVGALSVLHFLGKCLDTIKYKTTNLIKQLLFHN